MVDHLDDLAADIHGTSPRGIRFGVRHAEAMFVWPTGWRR